MKPWPYKMVSYRCPIIKIGAKKHTVTMKNTLGGIESRLESAVEKPMLRRMSVKYTSGVKGGMREVILRR